MLDENRKILNKIVDKLLQIGIKILEIHAGKQNNLLIVFMEDAKFIMMDYETGKCLDVNGISDKQQDYILKNHKRIKGEA
jgi:hypothetical protein